MTTNQKNDYPPYYNTHGTTPVASYQPPIQPVAPPLDWFDRQQKNKPQSNSVGSASLILISGGMSVAWGFWTPADSTVYMNISWFIAAIIGALLGATFTNNLQKKRFMFVSSLLVLIGGALFALHGNYASIMAARHLNGFAVGFIFAPALVMAGEESVKYRRGMVAASMDAMCFSLGMYIQLVYAASWYDTSGFTPDQMHGTLCIVYGILSFIFVFFLVIESPVFLLVRGQEELAINSLRRLQKPYIITYETYEQLQEHKRYIAENKEKTFGQSFKEGLPALFKLSIFRILIAMSLSFLMNSALITSTHISQGVYAIWPYIIYGLCRFIAALIAIFMIDTAGRKKPLIGCMVICGGLAIALGILFNNVDMDIHESVNKMTVALVLLFVFQFFSGIAAASSSAYLSEAFPLAVKPFCIAIAFCAEMLVHIIIATVDLNHNSITGFFFALAGLSLMFAIFTILCFPETKGTTLLEAQMKFRNFLSLNRELSAEVN